MGLAFDTNVFSVTNTGIGNFIPVTAFAGDTLAIKNFNPPSTAQLVQLGKKSLTAGIVRARSTLLHDDVQALRFRTRAADPSDNTLDFALQQLQAQDTLLIESAGTNTEVSVGYYSVFYSDLPGAAARLHMPGDVDPLIQQIVVQEVAITSAASNLAFASAALGSLYNVLKANRDYAVLGFVADVPLAFFALQGADTSNLKVGGGVLADTWKTRDFFVHMSVETGLPCIPVINAANLPATNLIVANDVGAIALNIGIVLGLLSSNLPN